MSLSWLDRLTLLVHPQRLVLERRPWRGATTRHEAAVAPAAAGETDWQPALAAADALLAAHGRRGAGLASAGLNITGLNIILADHFVRYALLPWNAELSAPKARQAMALALLRNALGEAAGALDIAVDRPAYARSGIAAGIDAGLLAGLRGVARRQRLRLTSVQPRLIAELARQHRQLADGWLACIDDEWLTLCGLRGGDPVCLHNSRASGAAQGGELSALLGGLLAAESAAVDGKNLLISCRAAKAPPLPGDWQTRVVPALLEGAPRA